jgi:hypothetical protein
MHCGCSMESFFYFASDGPRGDGMERLGNGSTYAGFESNGTTAILPRLSRIVCAWATTRKTLRVCLHALHSFPRAYAPTSAMCFHRFLYSIRLSSQHDLNFPPRPFQPFQSYTPPPLVHLPQTHQPHLTLPNPHSTYHARPVP